MKQGHVTRNLPVTMAAFEGLGTRVLPEVPRQFITPREAPLAPLP